MDRRGRRKPQTDLPGAGSEDHAATAVAIEAMKAEILREHYFFELNRKQQLESALALPVAAIAALIGVLALYIKTILGILGTTSIDLHLLIPSGLGALLFVTGLVFTILAFYGYKYSEVDAHSVAGHYDELMQYGASIKEAPAETEAAFEIELRGRYGEAVEQNRIQNQRRLWYLHWAKAALAAATIFLFYAAVPYFLQHAAIGGKAQRIEVVSGEVSVRLLGSQTSNCSTKEFDMGTQSKSPSQENDASAAGNKTGSGSPAAASSGGSLGKPQRPVMPENIQTRMEAPPPKPREVEDK